MKRWFAVGMAVLLVSLLLVGCGVPQEDYDAVVADKVAAEAKIPALESDLSKEKSEVSNTKSEITSVQSELVVVKNDLEAAQSALDSAESQASSAESQLSSLRGQVSSLNADISIAQGDLKLAEARIAELEAAIAAAEEAAAAAEEEEEAAEEIPPVLIGGIQLCSAITADGKCKLQPKATFDRGDTVYFYFQIYDFYTKTRTDGRYEVWLMIWGELYGPDGNRLRESDIVGWYHKTDLEYHPLYIYSRMNYESKADDEPGQYRFEFIVRDELSGAKGTGLATFTLSEEVAAGAEEEVAEAEYVNEEYGFSVKYPSAWQENPDMETRNTVFNASGAPYKIPGMSVGVMDIEEGVSFADSLVADLEEEGDTNIKVVSETQSTLADGTPASIVILQYSDPDGYLVDALVLGVEKGGKRISVFVYTVNEYAPFSKEKMSEVAHTLTFK